MLRQIQHQQRAHAVIAEAFPRLGREQAGELARVTEPGSLLRRIDVGDIRFSRIVRGGRVHHQVNSLKSCAPSRRGDMARETNGESSRVRSEEHTSELQSLMRLSYAAFCLKKKTK